MKRQRWDFRTGLFYQSMKPSEAPSIGLILPLGVNEVRIYSSCVMTVQDERIRSRPSVPAPAPHDTTSDSSKA